MDNILIDIVFVSVMVFSFLMIVEGARMEEAGRWLLKQIKRAYHAVF